MHRTCRLHFRKKASQSYICVRSWTDEKKLWTTEIFNSDGTNNDEAAHLCGFSSDDFKEDPPP